MDYAFLALVMTFAGFIDSLAGGGGVMTLPAYLAFGLNPALILGTNKLSSVIGTSVSAWKLRDRVTVSRKYVKVMAGLAFIFAFLGAVLSRLLNPGYLKFLILIIIPLIAWFIISNKQLGRIETRRAIGIKKSNRRAKLTAAAVACYDGFFGPGAGTMYTVFLTKYAGFDILQATALAKVLNFSSNLFALAFFMSAGAVDVKLGLFMACFVIIGNVMGVRAGKKHGAALIRPMIVIVCFMIVFKLIWDYRGAYTPQ
jgi:uncharacterized membrane protein YfcA